MPRARERVSQSSLPNGDIRRLRDGATNEVVASSRDHAYLRVSNTMERPATSTRSSDQHKLPCRWREGSPTPNTGFEVIVPGRQGFRARREPIPLAGAPTSIRTSLRSLSRSFPWCRGQSRVASLFLLLLFSLNNGLCRLGFRAFRVMPLFTEPRSATTANCPSCQTPGRPKWSWPRLLKWPAGLLK